MIWKVIEMGTYYYMVRGSEKIYIGRNIIPENIPDLYEYFKELSEKSMYDDLSDWDCKPMGELNIADYSDMYKKSELLYKSLQLFAHPRLLAFFIEHDWDMDWDCKTGYELEEEVK